MSLSNPLLYNSVIFRFITDKEMLQMYFEHFIDIVSKNRYYGSLPEDIDINIDAALLLVLLTQADD